MTDKPRSRAFFAVDALTQGHSGQLALLIEEGNSDDLFEMAEELTSTPEARERLARLVRTGKLLKRGESKPNMLFSRLRDEWLFNRVAYWIGRGIDDGWQDNKDATVWHFASEEWGDGDEANICADKPFPLKGYKPSTLYKEWRKRESGRWPINNRVLTRSFWVGVADEMGDVDDPREFIEQQHYKSQRWGFNLEDSLLFKGELLKAAVELK